MTVRELIEFLKDPINGINLDDQVQVMGGEMDWTSFIYISNATPGVVRIGFDD